ncbi:hypothetical protein Glove_313g28 [Diversispora epigaea]|uniref:Uncharacterized protein n=1 Tax=Diversispora epigaea TaxID=1348612 RepID=A0A397HRX6_9GLOM|nr:hypothetical protein Glove_313g28 [Diversispora epigaea]
MSNVCSECNQESRWCKLCNSTHVIKNDNDIGSDFDDEIMEDLSSFTTPINNKSTIPIATLRFLLIPIIIIIIILTLLSNFDKSGNTLRSGLTSSLRERSL